MTKKYNCGTKAAEECRNGEPTVYDEDIPSIRDALQYTDDEINEGIDQTFKNKTLRKILKNKTVKTTLSSAGLVAGHAIWSAGMAIGGDAGMPFAMGGLALEAVATMGVVHNVSNMKMVKALYHGVKNGVKTTVDELTPETKKIKDRVERFATALTEKDVPMTVRHYDRQTGKMIEYKMPKMSISQRVMNAFRAANRSGGK